jgi:hypothetical protein
MVGFVLIGSLIGLLDFGLLIVTVFTEESPEYKSRLLYVDSLVIFIARMPV